MDLFYRMLVYEYVDNGNLEQWLHGDVGPVSPLTWDIRMSIVLSTAKGYHIHDLICNAYICTHVYFMKCFDCSDVSVSFQTGLSS